MTEVLQILTIVCKVPLTNNDKFAYVDAYLWESIMEAGPWHLRSDGYVQSKRRLFDGRQIRLHRFVMYLTGRLVDELDVDHIDRDPLNNNITNLRMCTRTENLSWQTNKPHSSKYRGVSWHKNSGKWQAKITTNGQHKHLGVFDNEKQAARAYNEARRESTNVRDEYKQYNEISDSE